MLDELCETIDLARDTFSIKEVSSETNPNHLIPSYLEKLKGRVQRLSVGVQSFDDGLLKQMDRYDKYGCGQEILERIQEASPYFVSMNADMIFNFPAQTEDILIRDIERVIESGCSQTTFYPLMASPSVERSLAATVGKVDYAREQRFYEDHLRASDPAHPGRDATGPSRGPQRRAGAVPARGALGRSTAAWGPGAPHLRATPSARVPKYATPSGHPESAAPQAPRTTVARTPPARVLAARCWWNRGRGWRKLVRRLQRPRSRGR